MSVAPSTFAFADLWEAISASVPNRTALVSAEHRLSFAELNDRAARLAGWMKEQGVGPGTYVGVQMRNRAEHVEAMLAAYKLRAIPVNINYRLGPAELHYLYSDCGLVGVLHDEGMGADVAAAVRDVVAVRFTLEAGEAYEHALTAAPVAPIARSSDDVYALYTGGTTGNPKSVEWRMEDAFFACLGGGDPTAERGAVAHPKELVERILADRAFLPAAPLVHAAGMWTTLRWLARAAKKSERDYRSPKKTERRFQNKLRHEITLLHRALHARHGRPIRRTFLRGTCAKNSMRRAPAGRKNAKYLTIKLLEADASQLS